MSNKKVSQLNAVTTPNPADYLLMVSGGSSRRLSISDLAVYLFQLVTPITLTGNATLNPVYQLVSCDATTGAFTATLPTAASCPGKRFPIKKIDASSNVVTISTQGGEQIDSSGTTYLLELYNEFVQLESTGTAWIVTAE